MPHMGILPNQRAGEANPARPQEHGLWSAQSHDAFTGALLWRLQSMGAGVREF
jgi:hypothetical protein